MQLKHIYWNKLCELKHPDIVCQIEDISPLNILNIQSKNILLNKKNKKKLYQGVRYNKPKITLDMYKQINPILCNDLKVFCIKYNYKYILDN